MPLTIPLLLCLRIDCQVPTNYKWCIEVNFTNIMTTNEIIIRNSTFKQNISQTHDVHILYMCRRKNETEILIL